MEVTFKIDATASKEVLKEQKSAIDAFFESFLEDEAKTPVKSVKVESTPKRTAPKKATPKKAKPEPEEEEDSEQEEISFEELSSKVAEKIKELKDTKKPTAPIVKKLKSFGASKLDELDEEYYGSMLDYIEKL